jgi:hypothetical protein
VTAVGFKISWRNGKIVPTTNEEYIADALAEIREVLLDWTKGDERVWSGYPDGWRQGDEDDDDPRVPVGLFLNLERCTRSDPSWQIALAIRTAFELGRASIAGKASKAAYAKLIADTEALAVGRSKAAKITAAKKTGWHKSAKLIYAEQREASPDASADSIATIIVERLGPIRAINTIRNKIYEWDAERSSLPVS